MAVALTGSCAAEQHLPVFLSDNHAETFGWITRTFDPDGTYQLVLVDAHSDASMAERSEEIREGLRRVPSEEARADRIETWRASGRIQAFNWIEPLMPRPLERVCWLAAPELSGNQRIAAEEEAVGMLDGRLEVEPRSVGSFTDRWTTVDLSGFSQWHPGAKPVILAIDLDFFAGMAPDDRDRTFEAVWQRAMAWPGLAGVAFAVSRPWLGDDAEAEALVTLACAAVAHTRGAVLEIDASLDDRPDESKKAAETPNPIPRWDAQRVSDGLKSRWLSMGERLRMTDRKRDWKTWSASDTRAFIRPDTGEIDCDGVWRFPYQQAPALRLEAPAGATGCVRWFVLEPAQAAYDLLPETGLGKSFSVLPGRWIYETRRSLGTTEDFALAVETWNPGTPGRVRVEAEVETARGWLPVPPVELRLAEGSGFRGALSECFRMPYVFGIAGVAAGDLSGVESGWGSDCSNLLIHAWRRNGIPLAWGDPGRLRAQLATKAENITLADAASISIQEIERGVAIDFGRHMAALWEDREPCGELGGNDLVVHHLGGFPEIVNLETLAKNRPVFSLRVPRSNIMECVVKVAGDVVLAEDDRWVVPGFEKGDANVFLTNLEGVPSTSEPERAPRYDFRFPAERLNWLKEQGIDAVSLANNHAGDAGRAGLVEGLSALKNAGLGAFGAGQNEIEASQPWRVERSGVRLAVFGVCLTDSMAATATDPGVAVLPGHGGLLEMEIRKARACAEVVLIFIHGGDEYRLTVTDEQRKWVRWLAARGANLIVGAHPHVVQREERHAGSAIVYSLGNAVYPNSLKGADSGRIQTFRLSADGSVR